MAAAGIVRAMTPFTNPYAPPVAEGPPGAPDGPGAELEAIRREHLSSETNIKSIGALAILGAVVQLMGAISLMSKSPIGVVIQLMVCGLVGACGLGLRSMLPWARKIYSVLIGLGLVVTIVGVFAGAQSVAPLPLLAIMVAISTLFLWVLWNGKASVVFSEHYREVVVRATPHIKHKTSMISIVILIVLLLVLVAIVSAAVIR
jgi:hypothetical protein